MFSEIAEWFDQIRRKFCIHDWMEISYTVPGYTKYRCTKCGKVVYIPDV